MLNSNIVWNSFQDNSRKGYCSMILNLATSIAPVGGVGGMGYWALQFQYDFNSFYLAV